MTPQDRIRAMRKQLADIKATLNILDRLIAPAIISISNAVGDGYTQNGAGPSSGISDPVGAAIARASDAIEVDSQLRLTWLLMVESPNAVANLLRQAQSLTPRAQPIVAACTAGLHLAGYETWGRKNPQGAPVACDEIGEQDRDGLCLGCDKRRSRWRSESKIAS